MRNLSTCSEARRQGIADDHHRAFGTRTGTASAPHVARSHRSLGTLAAIPVVAIALFVGLERARRAGDRRTPATEHSFAVRQHRAGAVALAARRAGRAAGRPARGRRRHPDAQQPRARATCSRARSSPSRAQYAELSSTAATARISRLAGVASLDDLPIRDDLRGLTPVRRAAEARCRYALNVNENTHAVPEAVARDIVESLAAAVLDHQPLPRPRVHRRCASRSPTTSATASRADQIWAANGSNEIIQQLLQAFGGPGRSVLGFPPTYSMHSIIARGHRHRSG